MAGGAAVSWERAESAAPPSSSGAGCEGEGGGAGRRPASPPPPGARSRQDRLFQSRLGIGLAATEEKRRARGFPRMYVGAK